LSNPDYPISGYGELMADEVRMAAHEAALRAACRPGCVVLDIGTGTGILALLACRFGAARVYAIDFSDAVAVAREIAEANGFGDRIQFIQGLSSEVSLPEPVDVVVADVRGVLPLIGTSVMTLMDARRFLAPGGVIIPSCDTLRLAIVEDAALHLQMVRPWRQSARGFDLSPVERILVHRWRRTHLPASALLSTPADLIELEYGRLTGPNASGSVTSVITRPGIAHGLSVWFDARLFESIGFSNAPGEPPAVYGQAFFPLAEPVRVESRDSVTATLRAAQVQDDYVWSWDTTITSATGAAKACFKQSMFYGVPLSAASLAKLDKDAHPVLGANGRIDRFILDHLDGRTSLGTLARLVREEFPDRFPDEPAALTRVTTVISRYDQGPGLEA
jgi:protein arginine N-methyltransferase 1